MHDTILMEGHDGAAGLLEYPPDKGLGHDAGLDLVEEGAAIGVLQDHIGDIPVLFEVVVEEADDVGVFELLVHGDFVLGVFAVDLTHDTLPTIFMATSYLVSVLRASFTIPYEPNPIATCPFSLPFRNSYDSLFIGLYNPTLSQSAHFHQTL
jgi:hypothetical protein